MLVRGIAAPIRDATGNVTAAVGISVPAERLDVNALGKFHWHSITRSESLRATKLGANTRQTSSRRPTESTAPTRGGLS